jgi:predicted nucleotidyltransferase component of viral defense system
MLGRKYVDFYAYSSGVDRFHAEKDIVLTHVLKALSEGSSPTLHNLAFKGGTCIKKIYLGKTGRFSTDLDFTSLDISRSELERKLENSFYGQTHHGITFDLVEDYPKGAEDSYGAVVRYSHTWNQDTFKLEVSFRETPLLKVAKFRTIEETYFRYLDFGPFTVQCLQKEEILAEKIRAAFQRMGSRDLFDLYLFANKPYDRELVKKLAVIKLWMAESPFDPSRFLARVKKEAPSIDELRDLVRRENLPTRNNLIRALTKDYEYLRELSEELKAIVDDSRSHKNEQVVTDVLSGVQPDRSRSVRLS